MEMPERQALVEAFLTFLAVERKVSASTQNQAMNALVFFYKHVLPVNLGDIEAVRAKRSRRLPVWFTRDEVRAIVAQFLPGNAEWIMVNLLYGCGLRLMECLRLRVKDVDFEQRTVTVRCGKGDKDRSLPIPEMLVVPLEKHLRRLRPEWEGYTRRRVQVSMPDALDRKYPKSPYEWGWFFLFPASGPARDPKWGGKLHHIHETAVQKRIGRSIRAAGVTKKAGCHTFRHSFCTHWLENAEGSQDIALRRLQELMGHRDIRTTMIYLHLMKRTTDVPSPLDVRPGDLGRLAA